MMAHMSTPKGARRLRRCLGRGKKTTERAKIANLKIVCCRGYVAAYRKGIFPRLGFFESRPMLSCKICTPRERETKIRSGFAGVQATAERGVLSPLPGYMVEFLALDYCPKNS